MAGRLYNRPMQEVEPYYYIPSLQNLHHQHGYTHGSSHSALFSLQHPVKHYSTLDSSSTTGCYPNAPPSTLNAPAIRSPACHFPREPNRPSDMYGSPLSSSCITDDVADFKLKLKELETIMLGPEHDATDAIESGLCEAQTLSFHSLHRLKQEIDPISRKDLNEVLIACAKAVSENELLEAKCLMDELRQMVSVSGEPIQRLGAYMLEGLVARLAESGSSLYKALRFKEPASSELLSYMHLLYEVCPYLKFGYMSANGAIAEAMKDEDRVHIVDFQIAQGSQWVTLIQAFAARPGGPPHIRVTGIDDSTSAYARGGGLNIVGKRLSKLAELFNVPFEFHSAAISGCQVLASDLDIRPGEALAVNFAFMLHHMPDESVSTDNHRDRLLRMVKKMGPKVVTIVEQESNTNTAAFFPRFLETLNYYRAMFESIDVTLPRDHKERINVEQHCLATDVVNIVACEGAERVERHELLGKWRSRFSMAGFKPYPLSSLVNATIKTLLSNYCNKYTLEERDGALYLGWMNRDLVASCAWK